MDWTRDIPEELRKGLIYAIPTRSWHAALKKHEVLRKELRGFRPDRVPVRELDRLLLKAFKEEPEARDAALTLFREANEGLCRRLGDLDPQKALETREELLIRESASRLFWAAVAVGDRCAALREAVLEACRADDLPEGCTLLPPRFERRRADAARTVKKPRRREPAAPPPVEDERVSELTRRVRKLERERVRAVEARKRMQAERDAARESVLALEHERDRALARVAALENRLQELGQKGVRASDRRRLESERLALVRERERSERTRVQAVQRSRRLRRELNAVRERKHYLESLNEAAPVRPREPAGRTDRAPADKMVWPTSEHHYPKRLEGFLKRLSSSDLVDRIKPIAFEGSTGSRVKSVDRRGRVYLTYSDGQHAVQLSVVTVGRSRAEGLFVAAHLAERLGVPIGSALAQTSTLDDRS